LSKYDVVAARFLNLTQHTCHKWPLEFGFGSLCILGRSVGSWTGHSPTRGNGLIYFSRRWYLIWSSSRYIGRRVCPQCYIEKLLPCPRFNRYEHERKAGKNRKRTGFECMTMSTTHEFVGWYIQ
jgi:hypothetical protein